MSKNDFRDWFTMILVAMVWIGGTVFLFKHPEAPNFVTWSGVCVTMAGVYHWLCVHDDKSQDTR